MIVVDGRVAVSFLVVLVLIAGLVVADRRGRLLRTSVAVLGGLTAAWVLAAFAVRADFRDADGFIDCWSYCSTFQDAVGGTLFFGPLAGILVLVVTVALLALRSQRSGGGSRPRPHRLRE